MTCSFAFVNNARYDVKKDGTKMSLVNTLKSFYMNPYKQLKKDNRLRELLLTESEAFYINDILDREARAYYHCYDHEVTRKMLLDDCFKARIGQGDLWSGKPKDKAHFKAQRIQGIRTTSFRSRMLSDGLAWTSTLFFILLVRFFITQSLSFAFLALLNWFFLIVFILLTEPLEAKLYQQNRLSSCIKFLIRSSGFVLFLVISYLIHIVLPVSTAENVASLHPAIIGLMVFLYLFALFIVMWTNQRYAQALVAGKA